MMTTTYSQMIAAFTVDIIIQTSWLMQGVEAKLGIFKYNFKRLNYKVILI